MFCFACWTVHACFFFNDTATTEIYTLSLHDALPISLARPRGGHSGTDLLLGRDSRPAGAGTGAARDRKSTRLNSSHQIISYAVFCLKKKKKKKKINNNKKKKKKKKKTEKKNK